MKPKTIFLTTVSNILFICAAAFASVPIYKYVKSMKSELNQFRNKELMLSNMQKTLMVTYNLSSYESRYYSLMFDDFARKYNIPWEIYPAIIRVESNFKTTLGSSKGAKGIGQMLDATAKEVADSLGIDFKPQETPWNEILDLTLACTYLSDGIKSLGMEGGVKRYLGGPGYAKSEVTNKEAGNYIGQYKTTVWQEYRKLSYIHKGVQAEPNPSDSLLYTVK